MDQQTALANALRSRIDQARIRYPAYSLRAFAKKVGLSPASISLILSGKRKVSPKLARQLSDRLHFDPQERSEILALSRNDKRERQTPESVQLGIDQYQLLSDWRAFTLLNLVLTKDFRNDVAWIAEKMAIDESQIVETLERLKRLGMLSENAGVLSRTPSRYRTTEDVANPSLQRSHAQTLELAQASLENDDVRDRDFTWMTFPLDPEKMIQAKTLIRKFQDDLMELVGRDASATEVYRLAIQLFPLTKRK